MHIFRDICQPKSPHKQYHVKVPSAERERGVCLCCAFLQFSTVFSSLLSCRKKCFVLFYPTFSLNLTALTPLYYVRRQCYEKIVKLHDGNIGNFGNIGFFSYFTMFQKSLNFFLVVFQCYKLS